MGFYDISENVDEYIKMCSEYDGSHIYQELQKYLQDGKDVLELGSGPGLDIQFLGQHYKVTGSDLSKEFISRLKRKYPNIPFLKIDAINIKVKNKYDCIYSNKVLHHLKKEELNSSLLSQSKILNSKGIIAHTFWIGDESEEIEGLLFTYYRREEIEEIISNNFKLISVVSYKEFEESDSLLIIAEKKDERDL